MEREVKQGERGGRRGMGRGDRSREGGRGLCMLMIHLTMW